MSAVLTTVDTVLCGKSMPTQHGGTVNITSNAKLSVGGCRVLLQESIEGKTITGCMTPTTSDNAGPLSYPCTFVSQITNGGATKLTCNSKAVMLEGLKGKTDGMVDKVGPPQSFQALLEARVADDRRKLTAV